MDSHPIKLKVRDEFHNSVTFYREKEDIDVLLFIFLFFFSLFVLFGNSIETNKSTYV